MVKAGRLSGPRLDQRVHKLSDEKVCVCEVIRMLDAQGQTPVPKATTTRFFSNLLSRRHFYGFAESCKP
jgi:hypothetical protein